MGASLALTVLVGGMRMDVVNLLDFDPPRLADRSDGGDAGVGQQERGPGSKGASAWPAGWGGVAEWPVRRPMTRITSPQPGIMNISATRGSRTMLRSESMRLLPRRSGSTTVFSSMTRTKPAGSPRGEQSRPSGPLVASAKNGAASMKAR